jgi:hypothetical protein
MKGRKRAWTPLWRNLQSSAMRLVVDWEAAFLQRVGELIRVLREPDFWFSLIWVVLASSMLLGLAWLAVSQYDTFLRLQPRLCTKTLNNTRLLVIVMVAPLSLVFTLVASSEFLALRKRRAERKRFETRHNEKRPSPSAWAETSYFWLYTSLMLLSWAALFWAMRC